MKKQLQIIQLMMRDNPGTIDISISLNNGDSFITNNIVRVDSDYALFYLIKGSLKSYYYFDYLFVSLKEISYIGMSSAVSERISHLMADLAPFM